MAATFGEWQRLGKTVISKYFSGAEKKIPCEAAESGEWGSQKPHFSPQNSHTPLLGTPLADTANAHAGLICRAGEAKLSDYSSCTRNLYEFFHASCTPDAFC